MNDTLLEVKIKLPLDRFDLDVALSSQRRVVGVFGPSGSGKTTLLETIAGLRKEAKGSIRCGGATWLDSQHGICVPPRNRYIGYVPQDNLLFPHWNVRRNLTAGARRARQSGRDFDAAFAEAVRVLELQPLLQRDTASLSGGERQRVALGRALCSGPRLLMLDEPLASLDLQLRRKILPYLVKVRDAFEIPILIVSHNPAELLALCDEVVALQHGQVIAQGAPTDVFARSNVYAAAAEEGFENMLPAHVEQVGEHSATVRLGKEQDAPLITVPKFEANKGSPVTLGIPANDILVSTERITGISARNCIPATIASSSVADHRQIITAQLDSPAIGPALVVELTLDAVEELSLVPGRRVWLIVKSSSITVYQ